MSPFPELALAAVLSVSALTDPGTPQDATYTVEDLVLPVEDIIAEVESMDGAQSESRTGEEVTVALTSDVLFAVDKWVLTAKARQRLGQVAEKIKAESAGGVVKIEGHTDDQGADAYNQALSLKRARAVQQALQQLEAGAVTFEAAGFGETKPKLPNLVDGRPSDYNRAKNRRVEIIFNVKE
ncbi:OmpA family protein [Nonomuraea africana]|uniref:Outer membrane protein OmpA-like peptidoglycan-associated protein n=1 Tax=Nonomuraea africana TaxID=46171 RepID=A0ABR9KUZ2_9ACTN|nr:OmpA family protein [Nonomuraea africana]MBE1565825.1 outer membrane protein OmpA-like peptidoglycan-associated protein [Nonomuraea africana]